MLKPANHLRLVDDIEVEMIEYRNDIRLCHIYMEAQIFTPDSKRFLVHSGTTPHGNMELVPEQHQYFRCDLDNHGELVPLISEPQAKAPAISPDGKIVYYILDHTLCPETGKKGIELKKINIDGTEPETLLVIDHNLPGTKLFPGPVYSLSTISSDGRHLAVKLALLGDNKQCTQALLVLDVVTGEYWMPLLGEEWINLHPQYTRSEDPERRYDIMVQHNHGAVFSLEHGRQIKTHSGLGMDIHLICDDGTNMRDFPWGRAPDEIAHGHQCWIGRSDMAIEQCTQRIPVYDVNGLPEPIKGKDIKSSLIAGKPGTHDDHYGKHTPGSERVDISGNFRNPYFCHFATDMDGQSIIADGCLPGHSEIRHLFVGKLKDQGRIPVDEWVHIVDTQSRGSTKDEIKATHAHPFLSPDGKTGFFNSNESGILRPYIIRNLGVITDNK